MSRVDERITRLFCAVELQGGVRALIVRHAAHLPQDRNYPGVRWARGETLHLTLKFFGRLAPHRAAAAAEAMGEAAATPFSMSVAGAGAFPSGRRGNKIPRVLWLGARAVDVQAAAGRVDPMVM